MVGSIAWLRREAALAMAGRWPLSEEPFPALWASSPAGIAVAVVVAVGSLSRSLPGRCRPHYQFAVAVEVAVAVQPCRRKDFDLRGAIAGRLSG
jgi:hypothetical protein